MTQLSINTAQNVRITFNAASVGDRILAYLVDGLIKVAYGIVVYFVIFRWLGFSRLVESSDSWTGMAVILIFFFPIIIYTLTLESLLEGQTFGKRLLKIKVVKIDGYQASFGDYLIRWFCRIIDISTFNGVIALISVAVSEKSQRLGDMAAGTAVISLKNNVSISSTILEEIEGEYVPTYPLVIKLSDNDVRIIKETFNMAVAKGNYEMLKKLTEKIESVTGIKRQHDSIEAFIRTVLKDYNFYTQSM